MMTQLTLLQDWQVLLLSLAVWTGLAVIVALVAGRARAETRERSATVSAAYMTAFGSLFAILTAFLINAEYGTYRAAQTAIGAEVSAADQLASATAGLPPADAERVQALLLVYLDHVVASDWQALQFADASISPASAALRDLQQEVFARSSREYIPASVAETMQSATNAMTAARRERAVIASNTLPLPLFGIALVAGIALVVNGLLVAGRYGRRYALVATGIVLVVALDIGAILVITAPFQGGLGVSPEPFVQLALEIARGEHLPWVAS